MRTGIVIAMDKEFARVRALLAGAAETVRGGRAYTTGTMGGNEIVMVQCGVGKVNAAIWATDMINAFSPDAVVSTGVAGGASAELEVRDVVVATESCYHDAYCGGGEAYGQIMGMPARFASDSRLLDRALGIGCGTRVVAGLTVTGDWFVDSRDKMRSILGRFPKAMAVDMESAAIAQVCHTFGVPFVSFRIISDIPLKDDKASQYFDFWDRLADSSFHVTKAFLERL